MLSGRDGFLSPTVSQEVRRGGPSGTPVPTRDERSAFVIVGATCVSPVAEGEMRIDDRWSKSLGFLSLSQKSKIFDSRLRAARSRL